MRQGAHKDCGWIPPMVFMAIAVATFICAWIWPKLPSLCGDKEVSALCVRDWISATSGYAATIAAAITIYFLYRQNSEQKKQTDFLLGDAEPTIDAIQHLHRSAHVVVRIVNWNRRPIVVRTLNVGPVSGPYLMTNSKLSDRETDSGFKSRTLVGDDIEPPVAMHGWKNRSIAPCELRLDVGATVAGVDWSKAVVSVGILIGGKEQDSRLLTCGIVVAE